MLHFRNKLHFRKTSKCTKHLQYTRHSDRLQNHSFISREASAVFKTIGRKVSEQLIQFV